MKREGRVNDLIFCAPNFDDNPYWVNSLPNSRIAQVWDFLHSRDCVKLFDQNGYDLCPLELLYSQYNLSPNSEVKMHRNSTHHSIQKDWFEQPHKLSGCVLNHCLIFERKGYSGPALDQLLYLARKNPLIYKVIQIKPKWGIDFSLDYVDKDGDCFEVLHYEHDSFSFEDANMVKRELESLIFDTDFEESAQYLKSCKEDWKNLEFFDQSDWKCGFFGIPKERFKMVIWQ